mgnify:CR=1 FL=1
MAKGPFKMKGSPMQRNFGVSPVKQEVPKSLLNSLQAAANNAEGKNKSKFVANPDKEYKNLPLDKGFSKSNTIHPIRTNRGNANATFVREKIN